MSSESKKTKKVGFSGKFIRPITRKNRKTGTQNDSDSDYDSDSGSDYEEQFLPPTSQPLHVSEELILPSPAVLASARRNVTPVRYEPLITVYDGIVPGIGTYSQDYSSKFIQFLQENEIICNNDTTIKYLEFCLKYMFKEDFKKNVVNCIFFRGIVFDKNKTLGDYFERIQEWGETGTNNYFYIRVQLEKLPDLQVSNSSTDTLESDAGGSRKRRKTIKRRKISKRKKTGKKRKTIRKRK